MTYGQQSGGAGGLGALTYAVDIVFCLDVTESMRPVLESAKRATMHFHQHLLAAMQMKRKDISRLRIRVIAYRDFLDNASDAIAVSPFFEMPSQQAPFEQWVSALTHFGGGDEPESGLEALAVAMLSDWNRTGDKRRHLIVMVTDASSHPLEASAGRGIPTYPTGIPSDMNGLTDMWEAGQTGPMEFSAKRLLMYAPEVYPWTQIAEYWSNVLHFPSNAGDGLRGTDFAHIIDNIANSV